MSSENQKWNALARSAVNFSALLVFIACGQAQNVTTLDPPGSVSSAADGINNAGQIVGLFHRSSVNDFPAGYVLSGGTSTTIPAPSGAITWPAYGINGSGQVIGWRTETGAQLI
jgi:uncharacterized membrane protein